MTKENHFSFSDDRIKRIAPPAEKPRECYYDTKISKLELRVSKSGVKTFAVSSRGLRVTLGRFGDIFVQTARELSIEVLAKLAKGQNPNEEKRAIKDETTLGELFDLCFEYEFSHLRTRSQYKSTFDLYLSDWRRRRLSAITRTNIQNRLGDVLRGRFGTKDSRDPRGKVHTQNKVLEILRVLYNNAIRRGWRGESPVFGLRKIKQRTRDRFLERDELRRLFEALREEKNRDMRHFFEFALFSGARKSNILKMKWSDINFAEEIWTISESDSKNQERLRLPLCDRALEILKERSDVEGEYVFAGRYGRGHLKEPKKAWRRILDKACITDCRIHDLRRTLGSYQAMANVSELLIGRSLGHSSVQATRIYARTNLDPVRRSIETAAASILSAAAMQAKEELPQGVPIQ